MCSTWRQKILGPCSSRMCYIVSLAWKLERRRRGKFLDFVLQGEGKSQQDSSQANLLTCQYSSWAANACFFISCQISRYFSNMLFYHLWNDTWDLFACFKNSKMFWVSIFIYVLPFLIKIWNKMFFYSSYMFVCFWKVWIKKALFPKNMSFTSTPIRI